MLLGVSLNMFLKFYVYYTTSWILVIASLYLNLNIAIKNYFYQKITNLNSAICQHTNITVFIIFNVKRVGR